MRATLVQLARGWLKLGRLEVHMGRNVAPGWGWWRSGGAMVVIAMGSRMAVVSLAGR
jgi:hypothetical protein